MARPKLQREEYTVGWVCALPVELAAAQEMLDEEHDDHEQPEHDNNIYSLGRIGRHNVVIVCLPAGLIGNSPAAAVAMQMRSTFKGVRFGLMVGVGGGVPSEEVDIRLGDVVVSQPDQRNGGVIQYDFGKATPTGFQLKGFLNSPPPLLLGAVSKLRANQLRRKSNLSDYISKLNRLTEFTREIAARDDLFESTYAHEEGPTCQSCNQGKLVGRHPRSSSEPVIHYGTVASGNRVMKSGTQRDSVSKQFGGVLCFEMEAAGLLNSFPCLVIRGICDYADSHKNKTWQAYAAGAAAAVAKEILSLIPAPEVSRARTVDETIQSPRNDVAAVRNTQLKLLDGGFGVDTFLYYESWYEDSSIVYRITTSTVTINRFLSSFSTVRPNYVFLKVQMPKSSEAFTALQQNAPASLHPPSEFEHTLGRNNFIEAQHRRFKGDSIRKFVEQNEAEILIERREFPAARIYTIIWDPNGEGCRLEGMDRFIWNVLGRELGIYSLAKFFSTTSSVTVGGATKKEAMSGEYCSEMSEIEPWVKRGLPQTKLVVATIQFDLHEVLDFIHAEFSSKVELGRILTVTGSSVDAVAIKADDYVKSQWMGCGSKILESFSRFVHAPGQ
ncbi:hypothetical protein K4F52_008577, partial [Lecanicillium sp. MT-2017a]